MVVDIACLLISTGRRLTCYKTLLYERTKCVLGCRRFRLRHSLSLVRCDNRKVLSHRINC
ncbi:hypothetical protein IscW_ISCW013449 [Ixodes scapularis]|uniref:Uncharacterized protein n=1 Tax=Ixodes scapularis TaxID=6945 RepID=B7QEN2_IXOSC|nr:hypothetical protein IscW_ISCW013449 [Ixodes scapularis]|eukprot:XP_002413996.1 hypothetical protein IscW_ISCW013449 [Ixodes scapularis]